MRLIYSTVRPISFDAERECVDRIWHLLSRPSVVGVTLSGTRDSKRCIGRKYEIVPDKYRRRDARVPRWDHPGYYRAVEKISRLGAACFREGPHYVPGSLTIAAPKASVA
jgi:hypothetical protein